jgi:putative folate metabolism gamma-glutamate ligase
MKVTPVKTNLIKPGTLTLTHFLDSYLESMSEASILAITSKVVSLCENRIVPIGSISKEDLIIQESAYYLPSELSKYGHHFSIADNTLISSAGIDESNGDNNYVLWPSNPQNTANQLRQYLLSRFNLKRVGVVITDSTCMPLRRGTYGIALSHSGFKALTNYIGKADLFGRPFEVSQANIAEGLAAASVVVMGEGTEQTPMAVISELPFVMFNDSDPSSEELESLKVLRSEDLFAPFLDNVEWKRGKRAEG